MPGPEVWLVRHGATEWSQSGRHTGRTDIPLTDGGRAAARRVAPVLARLDIDRVLVSPLSRARETCDLAGLGDRAEVIDDLMEWDYGEFEGLTTPEIRVEHPGWTVWRDGCPGGERADDVGRRADDVVRRLLDSGDHGTVAVFGHGHALRVLAARWVELPAAAGAVLALDTAAVSTLGWEREQRVIRHWNVTVSEG